MGGEAYSLQVHEKGSTLRAESGRAVKRNLKASLVSYHQRQKSKPCHSEETEDAVASMPEKDRKHISRHCSFGCRSGSARSSVGSRSARRIEVLRWPSEPETAEELEARPRGLL